MSEQSGDAADWTQGLQEGNLRVPEFQKALHGAAKRGVVWMDEGVAHRAAGVCEDIAHRLGDWLDEAKALTYWLPFGDNGDGDATAQAYAEAGKQAMVVVDQARRLYLDMAQTYRLAGGAMQQAEQQAEQGFQSIAGQV